MIEDEIQENRRQVGRAFAREREPSSSASTGLSTSPIPAEVSVDVDIYTRPINGMAAVGHPDAGNAVGRGTVGDVRGSWALQDSISDTTLTRSGRRRVCESLAGERITIGAVNCGRGSNSASPIADASDVTRGRGSVRFHQAPNPVTTVRIEDQFTRDFVDETVSVAASKQEEVRVDATLTFSGVSRSSSEAVTDIRAVAQTLREADGQTIATLALGTDATSPTASDTSLGNEQIRKNAQTNRRGTNCAAETVIFRGEPTGQPYDFVEIGLFDDSARLMMRSVFDPTTKDDQIRLAPRTGFQIDNP